MCGLLAWVSARTPAPVEAIAAGTEALAHRGPDGSGVWVSDDGHVAMGHRRLAILGLGPSGAQPMHFPERDLTLVYNGEIYNHLDLRAELTALGYVFRSSCDTETLLHAYAAWGDACVERLNGIFAFALWDGRARRLIAARDPLGVKPLTLLRVPGGLALASQPRALLPFLTERRVDPAAMMDALAYGVVPGEAAIFAGMETLLPAELLTWDAKGETRRRYWSLPDAADIHDAEEAEGLVAEAVERAVRAQMLSDVPLATFLSGGIDSSLVTAVAAATGEPITAFTMGFEAARSDERPFAARAAEATGARNVAGVIDDYSIESLLEEAVEVYDSPFCIGASMPMLAVSRLAAEHGAKVVLSGDGADELFAGYNHYDRITQGYRRAGRGPDGSITNRPRALWDRLWRGPFDPYQGYRAHNGRFPDAAMTFAGVALREHARGRWREALHFDPARDVVDAAQRADLATYMTDEILVKVDRATMAHGIEARVPLLDLPLVELAFRIDPAIRYAGRERKALLKRAARKWLPDDVLTVRKKGFSLPVVSWVQRPENRARIDATLREGTLSREGLIDADGAIKMAENTPRPSFSLMQLYLTERWAGRWLAT